MLKTLQAGRALAALAVVAFHLSITLGDAKYGGVPVFGTWTRHGNLGVDFFFVLSGFIILHAHRDDIGRPAAIGRYVRNRFTRLFPIYWLYTALFVAAASAGIGAATLPDGAAAWFSTVTLIRLTDAAPPLPVAWTLFHELAFYALFALLIWDRRAGALVLGLWFAICLLRLQFPPESGRTPLAVYTAGYNLDFALGMAAQVFWRRATLGPAKAAMLAGVLSVGGLLALDYAGHALPARQLWYGVSFALLIGGAASLEALGRLRVPRPLAYLGDASYTIYLAHLAAGSVVLKLLARGPALGPEAKFVVAMLVSVGLCLLAYEFVERPLLRAVRRRPQPALMATA